VPRKAAIKNLLRLAGLGSVLHLFFLHTADARIQMLESLFFARPHHA